MNKEVKKDLLDLLKEEGLIVTEDTAELMIKALFKVLPLLAAKTTNTMDDMIVGALAPILERELLKIADKIDGEIKVD